MAFLAVMTLLWFGLVGFVAVTGFPPPGWRRIAYLGLLPIQLVLVGLRFAAYAGPEEWILGNEIQLAMMVSLFLFIYVCGPTMRQRREERAARRLAEAPTPT